MQERLGQFHKASKDPAVIVLLIMPIFLLYGLGQISASPAALAGVDFLSPYLRREYGSSTFILVQIGLALVGIAFAFYRLRQDILTRTVTALPAIAESILYALVLGTVVLTVMEQVSLLSVNGSETLGLDRWVGSAGAAFHEEFLFRLLLLPLLLTIGTQLLAMPQSVAVLFAVIGSSLLFAGAHHWAGETYTDYAFAYRSVAGAIFAVLQLTRGFAVAVWTHASYDFYVTGL